MKRLEKGKFLQHGPKVAVAPGSAASRTRPLRQLASQNVADNRVTPRSKSVWLMIVFVSLALRYALLKKRHCDNVEVAAFNQQPLASC
jgi:hypothetical protein